MLRRSVVPLGLTAALAAAATAHAAAPNLIANGSFDKGLSGFTTGYAVSTSLGNPDTIAVGTDSHLLNGYWASYHDHTSGSGPMLLVNGSTAPGVTAWSEVVPVAARTRYTLTVWAMALFQPAAQLRFLVDGATVGNETLGPNGAWRRYGFSWTSAAAPQATVQILDTSVAFGGNDFALDDVSFTAGSGGGSTGSRASTLATSVVSPSNALSSGKRSLENLAIAAVLVLFITFPAQLFNHTLEENYAEIREWWVRRFRWLEKLRRLLGGRDLAAGTEAEERRNTLRDTLAALVVVLAGGVLGGLLDPHFGFTGTSLVTFLSVVAATVFGLSLGGLVGFEYRKRQKLGTAFQLHALPAGLLIAAVCVLVSRLASFEPGYLYGLVCGVAFAGTLAKREEGQAVVLSELATISVALASWGLLVPLKRLAAHPHEAWPIVVCADFAGALFTGGIVGSMIGAFPLKFLPGGKVAAWHRGAWAALFGVAAFLFLELIINPGKSGHAGQAPLVTVLVLFVAFGAGSVWFYWHFARTEKAKEKAKEAAGAEPPETGPGLLALPEDVTPEPEPGLP